MIDNISTLNKELSDIELNIDCIFLDPNNPRFVSKNWDDIPFAKIDEKSVQDMTAMKLQHEFAVDRLIENIKINGFLPIDRIIVKEYKDKKYVVLEGNRRICAAKMIMEEYAIAPDGIADEVINSVKRIKCLLYTGSEKQPAWIFQGLRHVIGIQE